MRNNQAVARQLQTLFGLGALGDLTDGQLLERFATAPADASGMAFAALVERHGPMVLRACRAVLGDSPEALDAFQATFLVLLRRARGLWVRDSLGPWLYRVAHRTAMAARAGVARRRRLERRGTPGRPSAEPGPDPARDELVGAVHEVNGRLEERYRAPLVLCDLEQLTHEQASRHLGWPVGTIKSRLARGRARLRDRLVRRGFGSPAALAGAWPGTDDPSGLVPADLLASTLRDLTRSAAAGALAPGAAATLAHGVLRSMSIAYACKLGTVLLALGAGASGLGLVATHAQLGGQDPKADPASGPPTVVVKPANFQPSIIERGSLEPMRSEVLFNRVEGQTTIIRIVPEGTRVARGDVIAELDAAALRDQLINQEIARDGAQSEQQEATIELEVARIAAREYEEGIYRAEQARLQGDIDLAKAAQERAESRTQRTLRARDRVKAILAAKAEGVEPSEILAELDVEDRADEAEQAVFRTRMELEQAMTKLQVLEKYTKDRTLTELRIEIERKTREARRLEAVAQLEQSKVEKLKKQIEGCKIVAPIDGVIVYANGPNRPGGQNALQIEEGATVRERQMICRVDDIAGSFQVNAKVAEAWVDKLSTGMKARVQVDAFPNASFTGTVRAVAPLPDPSTLSRIVRKAYTTLITLDDAPEPLRPGLTARVEILLGDEAKDVIAVPASAVVAREGAYQVALRTAGGGHAWRTVTVGAADPATERVEIKQGLQAGDEVIADPKPLLPPAEPSKPGGLKPQPIPRPQAPG